MKKILYFLPVFLFVIMATSSCQKEKQTDDHTVIPSDSGKYIVSYPDSRLVTNLNAYRFEGAFGTNEPVAWPYLWVQFADDYNDSTRVVVLNQNKAKTITKHFVANIRNGILTRKYDHGSFPNDVSNSMSFAFEHNSFLLFWYDKVNSTITQTATIFGLNSQVSQIFTGMQQQFSYQFMNRYLIRYISGISLWPFHHANWTDETQFVATSELSAPKAIGHWFDDTWSTFPYDVVHNMYSGFFQSTNDATYVGIAKGSTNLDTIVLNHNPPDWYNAQLCGAFLDKDADTLYLATLVNIPNTAQIEASLYRLETGTNQMTTLYSGLSFPYQTLRFRKGKFYATDPANGNKIIINKNGQQEVFLRPVSGNGEQLLFSKNKIYAIVYDSNGLRAEVYSKPY
jgi:hypothetical protein